MEKRKIVIFTGNRAEYGLLSPIIKVLSVESALEVSLFISGSHLSDEFGRTIDEINTSDIGTIKEIRIDFLEDDERMKMLYSFSGLIRKVTEALIISGPDLILLAGDRYETFAVAISAFYLNVPIAHLFGGDLSQGGHLDDSIRHSITKLAHIHFTTNDDSYKRVLGLGEEIRRVFNFGSPTIDNIVSAEYATPEELSREFNIDITKPIILFTQHPITTESDLSYEQVKESLEALKELKYQSIITYPCNDAGSEAIIHAINEYRNEDNFKVVKSLGWRRYLGVSKICSVIVGNSSSGILESPFFKIPCVNIGKRQEGRLQAGNVINVTNQKDKIKAAIRKAITDKNFIQEVKNCCNPYEKKDVSKKIADVLLNIHLDKNLLQKKMTF